jgi:hypothetical protein
MGLLSSRRKIPKEINYLMIGKNSNKEEAILRILREFSAKYPFIATGNI